MTLDYTSLTMVQVIGEFNGTALPVQPIRDADNEFAHTMYAKILSPFGVDPTSIPKIGSTGVVIQKNKDDSQQVFWLGSIVTAYSGAINSDESSIAKEDSKVAISKKEFNVMHEEGSIEQNEQHSKFTKGKNALIITDTTATLAIDDGKEPSAFLVLNKNENKLVSKGSTVIRSDNDTNIQSNKGSVQIYGAKKENKDEYLPVRAFNVDSRSTALKSHGGPMFIEAGKMVINLSDSRTTHTIPGLGGPTAFELAALSGDIDVKTHVGNINITNMNSASIGSISIVNGSILSPTTIMQTSIDMKVNKIEICQSTIPFAIESYMKLSNASAEIYATRNIDIISDINVGVNATANVEIDAMIKAAVTAAKIEIISDVQTILKTAMMQLKADKMDVQASLADINTKIANLSGQVLNMEGMKMIKAGPKVVAPTGVGPFCAIPKCTWNGLNHVGDVAVG